MGTSTWTFPYGSSVRLATGNFVSDSLASTMVARWLWGEPRTMDLTRREKGRRKGVPRGERRSAIKYECSGPVRV